MSETMIERVARAIDDERKRWGGRTNKMRDDGRIYEIVRHDDSGFAGEFSEVHAFASYADSEAFMALMLYERPARAAIEAMREPNEAQMDQIIWAPIDMDAGIELYRAMIDAALSSTDKTGG